MKSHWVSGVYNGRLLLVPYHVPASCQLPHQSWPPCSQIYFINQQLMALSKIIIALCLCEMARLTLGNHCYVTTYQKSCNACTNGDNCAWCPSSCSCVMAADASRMCRSSVFTGKDAKCPAKCTLPTPAGDSYFKSISPKLKGNSAQVRCHQLQKLIVATIY